MRRDNPQISAADLALTRTFIAQAVAAQGETYLGQFLATDQALAAATNNSAAMEKAMALAAAA